LMIKESARLRPCTTTVFRRLIPLDSLAGEMVFLRVPNKERWGKGMTIRGAGEQ
jgi:hypothetical protein